MQWEGRCGIRGDRVCDFCAGITGCWNTILLEPLDHVMKMKSMEEH